MALFAPSSLRRRRLVPIHAGRYAQPGRGTRPYLYGYSCVRIRFCSHGCDKISFLPLSLSHSLRLTPPYERLGNTKCWSVRPAWPWDPTIFMYIYIYFLYIGVATSLRMSCSCDKIRFSLYLYPSSPFASFLGLQI